jgi:C-terminal processing protease CtpA/Prc
VVANRDSKRTRYTLASVPGLRRPTVPIWILIDRGTASAGEDFSFVLQQLGRAKTVGDRTAGAGHNNTTADLGHGFSASISITRVSDARSGKEWERVGVQPDVAVKPADALSVAHVAALDSLARLTTDREYQSTLATVRAGVSAQARLVRVDAATLARYVGTYEGERVVSVENDALVFRRDPSRPPRAMIAVDDSTFVLGALRVTFGAGADGAPQMVQHFADGTTFAMRRTGGVPRELAP